jgi:hypothetical protein
VPFSKLFIWVEGRDDSRFFEGCIRPLLKDSYDEVLVREYQQPPSDRIKKVISARNERGRHLVFADIDLKPCVTAKKEQMIQGKFRRVGPENVFIVVPEIESWYLAGLDAKSLVSLGLPEITNTDAVTKERFDDMMLHSDFDSRVDFMQEILRLFSIEAAKAKNISFRYFASKLLPERKDSNNG